MAFNDAMEDLDAALALQLQEEERQLATSGPQQQSGIEQQRGNDQFTARLLGGMQQVFQCRDEVLQALALSLFPESISELLDGGPDNQEELAKRLLAWFKNDFFKWVNNPVCQHCTSAETAAVGHSPPSPEEKEGQAGVVEVYRCNVCHNLTRFPRYNSLSKLLETRQGRCGEFANAFALICIAAGFKTRYVLDWTDHVWTEVYIEAKQRWVHLDSCENAFDQPHLYEAGWGKKLNYVLAFSPYTISDVSRRYSTDVVAMLERQRRIADPAWVHSACQELGTKLRQDLPFDERCHYEILEKDDLQALANLDKKVEEDLPGRQTGSEAWKAARGELGRDVQSKDDNDDASHLVKKNCSIPPSDTLASLSLNDPDSHDRELKQSQGGITQKSDSVSPHSTHGLDALSKDNTSNVSSTSSIRPSEP